MYKFGRQLYGHLILNEDAQSVHFVTILGLDSIVKHTQKALLSDINYRPYSDKTLTVDARSEDSPITASTSTICKSKAFAMAVRRKVVVISIEMSRSSRCVCHKI